MGTVRLARVYDPPGDDDGFRVLVDRVWPRGVRKADAHVDLWLREVGPSAELRRWFGHDPARFEEFARRYRAELAGNPATEELRAAVREHPRVTLVYGARDTEHNQAVVLAGVLR
jgi:DNA-3-methyladenine glycosylase